MVDMTRELERQPAREPLVSLAAVVRDFRWRYPRARRDMVVAYCANAPNLAEAIRRAVYSKDANGKHHNHQSKIRRDRYAPFLRQLLRYQIMLHRYTRFSDLLRYVATAAREVGGWGPVGVYDVATRVAAWLELPVDAVYLHAGVEEGARACFGPGWVAEMSTGTGVFRRIEPESFVGTALYGLDLDSVEDLLCTYRHLFEVERFAERKPWGPEPAGGRAGNVVDMGNGVAKKKVRRGTGKGKRQ